MPKQEALTKQETTVATAPDWMRADKEELDEINRLGGASLPIYSFDGRGKKGFHSTDDDAERYDSLSGCVLGVIPAQTLFKTDVLKQLGRTIGDGDKKGWLCRNNNTAELKPRLNTDDDVHLDAVALGAGIDCGTCVARQFNDRWPNGFPLCKGRIGLIWLDSILGPILLQLSGTRIKIARDFLRKTFTAKGLSTFAAVIRLDREERKQAGNDIEVVRPTFEHWVSKDEFAQMRELRRVYIAMMGRDGLNDERPAQPNNAAHFADYVDEAGRVDSLAGEDVPF